MSATTLASPAVSAFAQAVRAALADLPSDDVDDLTDGLEADLTERAADGGDTELGDPVAYAEELRSAAGLPPKPAERSTIASALDDLRRAPREAVRGAKEWIAARPMLTGLVAFAATLRPAWWVFRAVAVTALVTVLLGGVPFSGVTVVVGVVCLVVSVQFGRGKWLPFAWMRAFLLVFNVILAFATPFVLVGWATQLNNAAYAEASLSFDSTPHPYFALTLNGSEVSNIYAYDAAGNPLTDVQLFDQHGYPLNAVADENATYGARNSRGETTVPNQQVPGRLGWNIYPLAHVPSASIDENGGEVPRGAVPSPAKLPFATTAPLAATNPTSAPTAAATASPTGGPTATPAPTAVPTPAPTPVPTP